MPENSGPGPVVSWLWEVPALLPGFRWEGAGARVFVKWSVPLYASLTGSRVDSFISKPKVDLAPFLVQLLACCRLTLVPSLVLLGFPEHVLPPFRNGTIFGCSSPCLIAKMGAHDEYANPLLLDWVKEWLDTAKERSSKGVTTYKTAYESLKACPIAFQHPRQLTQLKGFGDKLTSRLTDMLKKHCEQNGLPMPEDPRRAKRSKSAADQGGDDTAAQPKKPRKVKPYVPAYRSGAYALILALSTLNENENGSLTKTELIELAQEHCDASFTAPSDPTKFYTAWNSMKTLVDKEYVTEKGRPLRRYALTDEGWEVAKRIRQTASGANLSGVNASMVPSGAQLQQGQSGATSNFFATQRERSESVEVTVQAQPGSSISELVADGPVITDDASLPSFTPVRLDPGTFTVQLLLDVREVRAKTDRDYMQDELAKKGVKPIMRSLELGDAQWVAVPNDPSVLARNGVDDGGREVVLDWIVERKRLDDLVSSIKDGRFHEQKFRLGRSGVRNVTYIIEEIALDATHIGRYEESVQSAIATTQVVNGYFVKKTAKMDDTIRYLARMTATLKRLVEARPLFVIPTPVITTHNYLPLLRSLRARHPDRAYCVTYPAFASLASKSETLTLRDLFLKMLMTTRGVTGEKALEIQKRWRTPREFVAAFEACGPGEAGRKRKRELVANATGALVGRRKIAKAVSQRIAEVWGDA